VSFVACLSAFALGLCVGGVGGIILGFVWYERKCRLLSDDSGKRRAAIRYELDDVFALRGGDRGDTVSSRRFASRTFVKPEIRRSP